MENDSIEQIMRLLNANMQNIFTSGDSNSQEPLEDDVSILNNIIREYNQNISLYQTNMRVMIDTLRQSIRDRRNIHTRRPAPRTFTPQNYLSFLSYLLNPTQTHASTSGITSSQMHQETRIVQYDVSMNEVRCPICLEDFQLGENICQIIRCGHIFKQHDLARWFERNNVCPVCRCDVTGGSHSGTNRQSLPRQPYQFTFEIPLTQRDLATFRVFDPDLSYNGVD